MDAGWGAALQMVGAALLLVGAVLPGMVVKRARATRRDWAAPEPGQDDRSHADRDRGQDE
ncbi:MAG: hypothetical protein WBM50_07435 [Acidimicrobiales bacterium]